MWTAPRGLLTGGYSSCIQRSELSLLWGSIFFNAHMNSALEQGLYLKEILTQIVLSSSHQPSKVLMVACMVLFRPLGIGWCIQMWRGQTLPLQCLGCLAGLCLATSVQASKKMQVLDNCDTKAVNWPSVKQMILTSTWWLVIHGIGSVQYASLLPSPSLRALNPFYLHKNPVN